MEEPTEAQIKEFWEWCGWEHTDGGFYKHPTIGSAEYYDYETNSTLPPIDLNSLFEFAVPKVIPILFENGQSIRHAYDRLFKMWLDKWAKGYEIEDALFWAMREVIHDIK